MQGELDVVLREARKLPVWGFPGQSNPYVRLLLGEQVRLFDATEHVGGCVVRPPCIVLHLAYRMQLTVLLWPGCYLAAVMLTMQTATFVSTN